MIYRLVISACGVAIWGWFLGRRTRGRQALPREALVPAPWGGLDVLLGALFFITALGAASMVLAELVPGAGTSGRPEDYVVSVAAAALANALTVGVVVLLARRRGRGGLAALGLRARPINETLVLGFLGFFAVMPLLEAFTFVFVRLAPILHYQVRRQEVVNVFLQAERPPGYALVAFYALVGAPVVEEVLFRGFLQGYLRRRFSAAGAVVVSAAVFGLFHTPVNAAVSVFLLGLVLGYQRERTQSLAAPLATHILFNLHTFFLTQMARL